MRDYRFVRLRESAAGRLGHRWAPKTNGIPPEGEVPFPTPIRAHAEAVADVIIAGIAVTPPGPGPDGTAGNSDIPPEGLD